MPLVKYVGNSTPQDNTEIVSLKNSAEGEQRSITLNGAPVEVSGEELLVLAGQIQLEVLPDDYKDDGSSEAEDAGAALDKMAKEQGIVAADDSSDEKTVDVTSPSPTLASTPSPSPSAPASPAPQTTPAAPGSAKE